MQRLDNFLNGYFNVLEMRMNASSTAQTMNCQTYDDDLEGNMRRSALLGESIGRLILALEASILIEGHPHRKMQLRNTMRSLQQIQDTHITQLRQFDQAQMYGGGNA